jgi:hypothetical protein
MKNEEIIELYLKYLNREPTLDEIERNKHKKLVDFEDEIQSCVERRMMGGFTANGVPRIKIALLLPGHLRNMNISHFLKNKNNNYDIHDIDVFIHTWDNLGFKGNETDINDSVDRSKIESMVNTIPKVKKYIIENNKKYILENEDSDIEYFNWSSPEVFIKSQLYSIYNCYKLMEEYAKKTNTKYELVIKARHECDVPKFNISKYLLDEINSHDIIFVPNKGANHNHPEYDNGCETCNKMYYKHNMKVVHVFEHTNIVCDLYAYGSMKSMKDYCSLYLKYDDINRKHVKQNLKFLNKVKTKYKKEGNTYYLDKTEQGHLDTLYYYTCSYPERILTKHLKDYMLVSSEEISIAFTR